MASKRKIRREKCTGKVRYATAEDAWGHNGYLIRVENKKGALMDVYHCPFCRGWHIGHRPRHKQPKIHAHLPQQKPKTKRT